MSSFDFGDKPQESDPTADFLARERAAAGALQGDADLFGESNGGLTGTSLSALQSQSGAAGGGDRDFEHSASNFPALDGEEDDGFGAPQVASSARPTMMEDDGDDLLGGGLGGQASAPAVAPPVKDEFDQFERNFPELDDEQAQPEHSYGGAQASNGFMAAPVTSNMSHTPQPNQGERHDAFGVQSDPYGVNEEEEPEAVRRWREEQEEDIAKREANAERRKGETISKAEQDIDNFYVEYNKKKEKNIAKNKEAEAQFKAQRQAELADGTTWSRVTKLLDLQNSQSKTIARSGPGSSDLTRMKEILLSLRREGETAPGASGY